MTTEKWLLHMRLMFLWVYNNSEIFFNNLKFKDSVVQDQVFVYLQCQSKDCNIRTKANSLALLCQLLIVYLNKYKSSNWQKIKTCTHKRKWSSILPPMKVSKNFEISHTQTGGWQVCQLFPPHISHFWWQFYRTCRPLLVRAEFIVVVRGGAKRPVTPPTRERWPRFLKEYS